MSTERNDDPVQAAAEATENLLDTLIDNLRAEIMARRLSLVKWFGPTVGANFGSGEFLPVRP